MFLDLNQLDVLASPAARDRAGQATPEAPAGLRHPVTIPDADDLAHQFLAFCRGKPAGARYDYWACDDDDEGCAAEQFRHFLGVPWNEGGSLIFDRLHEGAVGNAISDRPWTYRALASRLSTALTEQGDGR